MPAACVWAAATCASAVAAFALAATVSALAAAASALAASLSCCSCLACWLALSFLCSRKDNDVSQEWLLTSTMCTDSRQQERMQRHADLLGTDICHRLLQGRHDATRITWNRHANTDSTHQGLLQHCLQLGGVHLSLFILSLGSCSFLLSNTQTLHQHAVLKVPMCHLQGHLAHRIVVI